MYKIKISIFLVILFLTSCQSPPLYYKLIEVNNKTWKNSGISKSQEFAFEVPVLEKKTSSIINVIICFEKDINTQKLLLGLLSHSPEGEERFSEHEISLFDNQGNIKGKINEAGKYYFTEKIKNYNLSVAGNYKFEVENYTKIYEIQGIISFGLEIQEE